ncbi:3-dehydroquinate synthase [Stieleria varia]|uniref:3-dehydroquinate synthase n=1 Tax=Stieleria varia TaxID=2528005 RepID=A0A5C5ZUE7_9BACT|nr:3-dehydroquinate synthase [Stieleria varia]TWT91162.1 3-dehydroquinate synthase [Stieleria varia]
MAPESSANTPSTTENRGNIAAASGRRASITVELAERSYPIEIGTGITGELADVLRQEVGDLSHALVIADESIQTHWADPIIECLSSIDNVRVNNTNVPSGETTKSVEHLSRLWDWLLSSGADRRSVLFAIGGGVVGDLAGFAAASFTRGIRFVQIPTTLLAMVDSSVGGKTGINLSGGKNMVGAFWQPELVWIDTACLQTMGERDYLSGLAEVVKYGVIEDAEFFDWLCKNAASLLARDHAALQHAVTRSCQSKARVVRDDERETSGRRAILNYGHTFAHAIEATAGYGAILHGEAVSIGMQMAASLAIDMGLCDESLLTRQTELLTACGLPVQFADADADKMLPVMMRDKKVAHGKLRFILPTDIGNVQLVGDVDPAQVRSAIQAHR